LQKILALGITLLFSLVIPNFSFGQIPDIEMKASLKKGDYVESNLWFQNLNLTLAKGNSICPDSNCKYEIQDGTFNTLGSNDRYIGGTLKMENKSKSDSQGNFTSFNYYDLSGSFNLLESKENQDQKIFVYAGDLTLEKKGDSPQSYLYSSKVTLTEPTNAFVLTGAASNTTGNPVLDELKGIFGGSSK
jgi:hypothetical protein